MKLNQSMKKALQIYTLLLFFAVTTVGAQNVFEPATVSYTPEYDAFLEKNLTVGSDFYYLCAPSFSNEYALSFHGDTLIYIQANEKDNIWYSVNYKAPDTKAKTKRYEMLISREDRDIISDLMDAATMTANFYESRIGCDGTIYSIRHMERIVTTWSPIKESRTDRTVMVMDSICHAVKHHNRKMLSRQLKSCRALTSEFRQLYPIDYFSPHKVTVGHEDEVFVPDEFSLRSNSNILYLTVRVDESSEPVSATESYIHSLQDSVTVWSRELFLNGNDCRIYILLCDTTDARCVEYGCSNYYVVIPRKKLCRSLIFSIAALGNGYYRLTDNNQWQSIRREEYPWWPNIFDML